jgi:phosphoribosylanthranilate isomerase
MASRTRIKICGMTRPEDGLAAARVGVDAIGLVFYDRSPRAVGVDQARAIVAALPPFVTTVALFVDAEPAAVKGVLEALPVDLLQFHGEEPPEYCRVFGRPYIKALRMRDGVDVASAAERYGDARGLLLDAYRPGTPGGTGEVFDWNRIPRGLKMPVVLAGGLGPDNVARAISEVTPFAVDVSSAVESAPGIKDAKKMAALVEAVTAPQERNEST